MNPTAEKVRLVMLALRHRRLTGEIPDDAPVSTAAMARVSQELGHPVAESTFRRIENNALAAARLALSATTQPRNPRL